MKKINISLLFLFYTLTSLRAQYYQTGVEPFATSWQQIKTEKYRVIFPSTAQRTAVKYLDLLSVVDTIAPKSLKTKNNSIDVIIHSNSILSNGFVVWAPKRMEIISTYPTVTYPQPWLNQLALHETRHVAQMSKLNSGLIKPLSYLFGQQVVGVSAGFVPSWYLEGDAVVFETAASNSGRGRQANFYQYYRAQITDNPNRKNYSYDKWLLGSYRDKIPSHYNLGYQMVGFGRLKFGEEFWPNILRYISRNPYTLIPFYFGLKRETGLSRKGLFKSTFSSLDSIWSCLLYTSEAETVQAS